MVAADLRVAERRPLLLAAVHLDDRGVEVDGQRCDHVGRSGADRPQPGEELAADRVELADVGPLVRPQPRPDRRGRSSPVEQRAGRPDRSTATSLMLSPPVSIDPITDRAFAPLFAPCAARCSRRSIARGGEGGAARAERRCRRGSASSCPEARHRGVPARRRRSPRRRYGLEARHRRTARRRRAGPRRAGGAGRGRRRRAGAEVGSPEACRQPHRPAAPCPSAERTISCWNTPNAERVPVGPRSAHGRREGRGQARKAPLAVHPRVGDAKWCPRTLPRAGAVGQYPRGRAQPATPARALRPVLGVAVL